jgi:hypothetical protein
VVIVHIPNTVCVEKIEKYDWVPTNNETMVSLRILIELLHVLRMHNETILYRVKSTGKLVIRLNQTESIRGVHVSKGTIFYRVKIRT